jgi:hypothetical protein
MNVTSQASSKPFDSIWIGYERRGPPVESGDAIQFLTARGASPYPDGVFVKK